MVFTTLRFIIFMGIVFCLYYTVPKKAQWKLLLVASYVFYACASPLYVLFLVFTTGITFAGSRLIEKYRKRGKSILIGIAVILLGMVVVFKYASFLIKNVSALLGVFGCQVTSPTLRLILPLGLSFYVFQSLGYCIDVYREMVAAEKNFFRHALYVSYFPQLLQGPIGDYAQLSPQLFEEHSFSYKNAVFGLQRAAWGFFKKLVIANQISLVIDSVWTADTAYSGLLFWIFVLCLYSIQLYADFSGYMDIALGCSQMFGITLAENFETPYFSKSIAEFWRRWHITLGAWFKNYVFYPLLRSKSLSALRKKWRKTHPYLANTLPNVTALFIVWLLIGLWHGADWSYVVYGLFHGAFIIASVVFAPLYAAFNKRFPALETNRLYSLFRIVRTFLIVTFGYVIFRPANLRLTHAILQQMFSGLGISSLLHFGSPNFKELSAAFIGFIVLFCMDMYHIKPRTKSLREVISKQAVPVRWCIYLLFVCSILILGVYGKSELNQFAYFRF